MGKIVLLDELTINQIAAGEVIEFLAVIVIRGTSIPLFVELTSSMEEASGVLPVSFMPTL